MALDLLIRGVDKVVGDGTLTSDEEMAASNRKGGIATYVNAGVEAPSRHLQGKQIPPSWIVVRTDWNQAELDQHTADWHVEPEFTWESLNVSADRWRAIVVSKHIRTSDSYGGMDEARSSGFMLAWDFTNIDYLPNRARGRATIFVLASSNGLWRVLGDSGFEELSYDSGTGEHVIRMDYGAIRPNKDAEVRADVESVATFVDQDAVANTIDFMITRDQVKVLFEEDVTQRIEQRLASRRLVLDPAEVDRIAAAGGYEEIAGATLSQNMLDVLDA